MKMNRKRFLQIGGMGALGASFGPSSMLSSLEKTSTIKETAKIAVQLYSVRKEIEKDIRGTLKKIADIGFDAVETAFWPKDITVKQAGQYLKEAGLPVCSAHIELPIGEQKAVLLETAKELGCKKMIWH